MRGLLRFYFLEATPDNRFLVYMRLWFTLATTAFVVLIFGLVRFDGSQEFWLFVTVAPVVWVVSMLFVRVHYQKARAFHDTRAAAHQAPVIESRPTKRRRRGKP